MVHAAQFSAQAPGRANGRFGQATAEPINSEIFSCFDEAPDRPFVVAQLGQSLDGRIATVSGDLRYINGHAALDHLHRLRANVDAVVVGAATIAVDDPRLTVRRVPGRSPARVVIDPRRRVADAGHWLTNDGILRYLVTCCSGPGPQSVEAILLEAEGGTIPPAAIVQALALRGHRRILIEGGARTISAFIDAGCIDRLHILVAPVIIGSGKPSLELAPIAELHRARRPPTQVHLLGDGNVLFDCDLAAERRGR